jgi:hypothetical protein
MQQTTEDNNTLVKVEFLCADCKNGKHGCAKLWRCVGLEIGCYCSCTVLRSITLAEGKQLEKEGRHEENIGVRGLGVQSEPTTTSALNRPAYKAGGLTYEA